MVNKNPWFIPAPYNLFMTVLIRLVGVQVPNILASWPRSFIRPFRRSSTPDTFSTLVIMHTISWFDVHQQIRIQTSFIMYHTFFFSHTFDLEVTDKIMFHFQEMFWTLRWNITDICRVLAAKCLSRYQYNFWQ